MQNYYNENEIPLNEDKKIIGSYFGQEILLYSTFLKWHPQLRMIMSRFDWAVAYIQNVHLNNLQMKDQMQEPHFKDLEYGQSMK
jgi:hypothetical protein